jgi:hypothetical protein
MAGLAATAVLVAASAGCAKHSTSTPASPTASSATSHSSTTAQPTGYTRLLISAADIKAPVTFKGSPPIENPNGKPGAAATFSDDDSSHVIHDTIEVLPDPAAAASALNAAKATPPGGITGKPAQANIGTGGVTISGDTPDKSKGVTVLLFTQGKALVTLQFDGPAGVPAPPDFINDVGQKQAAAIKSGLPA